mgnify:CR=1 FL=1
MIDSEQYQEILDFLPLQFRDPGEQEYIAFLWDAFDSNLRAEKYQFAFMAYQMMFMSFVYFNVWQVKTIRHRDFQMIKLGFSDALGKAGSPFAFSEENESKILDLLRYVCSDHSDVNALIGKFKALVKERNKIAHASGLIPFSTPEYLDAKCKEILRYAGEVQGYCKSIIHECFINFLIESQDPDTRENIDTKEHLDSELLKKYYLSAMDVKQCLEVSYSVVESQPGIEAIVDLFETLREQYSVEP